MTGGVNIRAPGPADAGALERLAGLDSSRVPREPLLLADLDGELVAAVSVRGGVIADPFRHTAGIGELLELRAAQLRAASDVRGRRARRVLRPVLG